MDIVAIKARNEAIPKGLIFSGCAILVMLVAFVWQKPGYLLGDTKFWFGLMTLPISFTQRHEKNGHYFSFLAFILIAISSFFTTTAGLYLILIFGCIYLLQQHFGKLSYIFICHALLLSPILKYFLHLLSIPLRLQLTKFAGWSLNFIGTTNEVTGNVIHLNGTEFLVDQACAGLSMMYYGFLFGTIIMAYHEKQLKPFNLPKIGLLYLALLFLTLASNFIRLILMIIFNIGQKAIMHEGLGLIIFLIYVLIPFYFLSKIASSKKELNTNRFEESAVKPVFIVVLVLSFVALSYKNKIKTPQLLSDSSHIELTGSEKQVLKNGVIKFYNSDLLLYVKPPVSPYKADHNPMICWQGSGYSFKKIFVDQVNGQEVHFAELIKGEDTLYTAWWFDSGLSKVTGQWDWRIRAMQTKEQFYLINITSSTPEELQNQIKKLSSIELIGQS